MKIKVPGKRTAVVCSVVDAAKLLADDILTIRNIKEISDEEKELLVKESMARMMRKVAADPKAYDLTIDEMRKNDPRIKAWRDFFKLLPKDKFRECYGYASSAQLTPVAAYVLSRLGLTPSSEEHKYIILCLQFFPLAIFFLPAKKLDSYMCSVAVAGDQRAIQFVPRAMMTTELMLLAVQVNGLIYDYIKDMNPPMEVAIAAVRNDIDVLKLIPDKMCLDLAQAALQAGRDELAIDTETAAYKRELVFRQILKHQNTRMEEFVIPTLEARKAYTAELTRDAVVPFLANGRINHGMEAVLANGLPLLEVWDNGSYKMVAPDEKPVFSSTLPGDKAAVTGFDLYKRQYSYPIKPPEISKDDYADTPGNTLCAAMEYGAPYKTWVNLIQAFYTPYRISELHVCDERESAAVDTIETLTKGLKAVTAEELVVLASSYNTELGCHTPTLSGSPYLWGCIKKREISESRFPLTRTQYYVYAIFKKPRSHKRYLRVEAIMSLYQEELGKEPLTEEHVKHVIACGILQHALRTYSLHTECATCGSATRPKNWLGQYLRNAITESLSKENFGLYASWLTELKLKETADTGEASMHNILRADLFARSKPQKHRRAALCLILAAMLELQLCGDVGEEQVKILKLVHDYYISFYGSDELPIPWAVE